MERLAKLVCDCGLRGPYGDNEDSPDSGTQSFLD